MFDVCRAINLVVNTGDINMIYNIGTGKRKFLISLLSKAKWYLKSPSQIACIDTPITYNQAVSTYLNTDRLNKLGFIPLIGIDEGIQDLCHDQKVLYSGPYFDGTEIQAAINTLKKGEWYPAGKEVATFERQFSNKFNFNKSLMVNSGSSAKSCDDCRP